MNVTILFIVLLSCGVWALLLATALLSLILNLVLYAPSDRLCIPLGKSLVKVKSS
jgi:hypothetical protein